MKKILLITLFALLSCNDESCEDEKRAINEKYRNLIEQIYDNEPVDTVQLKMVNDEWTRKLANVSC